MSPIASIRRARTVWLAMPLLAALTALAQPAEVREDKYVLRASTVAAQNLPQAMRDRHGIPDDPRAAVLNITLQRSDAGAPRNVAADVSVQARNLYGVKTDVQLRRVEADGQVSYLGVYHFLPREVLDFEIVARPEGAPNRLRLEFRDRLSKPES
jgi:Domain of unknown function (DUF4426)